jgi:hypothetical protein
VRANVREPLTLFCRCQLQQGILNHLQVEAAAGRFPNEWLRNVKCTPYYLVEQTLDDLVADGVGPLSSTLFPLREPLKDIRTETSTNVSYGICILFFKQ